MPLTIREIKQDLKRLNILDESYEAFESNIKDTDKSFNCTINDYLVQIWINVKLEVQKCKPHYLLPLIPHEQVWFKKILIKMMIGRKIYDFSPLANALAFSEPVSESEKDYLFQFYPTGSRSHRKHLQEYGV